MVNIGIIGCGHWGSNHIRVFNASARARVLIGCDNSQSRLNALSKAYPGMKTVSDYKKVVNNPKIDAVVVATHTAAHYRIVKDALLRGKHVLCEKPLTIKENESKELLSIAKEEKRMLMVGYVFLFNNGIVALKNYIKQKELGNIHYLNFTRTNLGPIRGDVDVIYDLASHDISIASFLLNQWPECVSASAGFFLRKDICDIAFITLYYPANILVNIHVSWLDPRKTRRLICVGNRKMAIWNDMNPAEPIRIFNKGIIRGVNRETFYSDYGEFQLLPREGEVISPLIKLTEPLKNQSQYFLDCLENNRQPLTNAEFGHKVTKVLEAIEASLKNNNRIEKIRGGSFGCRK